MLVQTASHLNKYLAARLYFAVFHSIDRNLKDKGCFFVFCFGFLVLVLVLGLGKCSPTGLPPCPEATILNSEYDIFGIEENFKILSKRSSLP